MSVRALTLVGFLDDRAQAIEYLRSRCLPGPDKNTAALEADWRAAKARLGPPPVTGAGHPNMRPLSIEEPHLQELLHVKWRSRFQYFLDRGAVFQMIEIDRLIAGQITIDLEKSSSQSASLSRPPTHDELMKLAFPLELASGTINASRQENSVVVKSESLNLVIGDKGPMPKMPQIIGIHLGWTLPLIHVVRLNGKCILHNGYNRTIGARLAGAKEIPCIFRDVPDAAAAGFVNERTLDEALLMSDNPPTMAHYVQDRAVEVALRRATRVLQVSWSEHTLYDED
jgi:hypothetical protein